MSLNDLKICLIGNNNFGKDVFDGQRIKVREYLKIFSLEGMRVDLVDLEYFHKNPFYVLKSIKKGIANCDIVVFISASRGVRFLLPYINKVNKKYKKRIVLPLVGSSVLHYFIDKLDSSKCLEFFLGNSNEKCSNRKMIKNLKRVDLILPETDILKDVFSSFYSLSNIKTLPNLRLCDPLIKVNKNGKYVFISRINEKKGIFDLINAVNEINSIYSKRICLDIYGSFQLSPGEIQLFESLLSGNEFVHYCGTINPNQVIEKLSQYDYLVFPTKFVSEGIPGIIAESLIAGTPVISSDYPQVWSVLENNINSLIYKMDDNISLKNTLINSQNKSVKNSLTLGAKQSSFKYIYKNNKKYFMECIVGDERNYD